MSQFYDRIRQETVKMANEARVQTSKLFRNNKVVILKNLNRRQRVSGVVAVSLCLVIISLLSAKAIAPDKVSTIRSISEQVIVKARRASLDFDAFRNVEKYEVPNAKKTVVFIPQIHKEPTADVHDSKNDQAYIIQKDIYQTLNKLVNDNHITYVMDETDLYGPMPADKISKVKAGIEDVKAFRVSLKKTLDHYLKNGGSPEVAKQIEQAAEKRIDKFERSIYLTGGAAVLAAENPKAHVYGSQNAATINEARKQLQNIVYMESRISELENKGNPSKSAKANPSQAASVQQILAKLGSGKSSGSSSASLNPVYALAKTSNDDGLKKDADETMSRLSKLQTNKSFETAAASTSSARPSTNPYASETNLNSLKKKYDVAYAKFMKLAKDQRSQEVADNVEKEMNENNQNSSILVLGEQHKDQLVSALNKKGINVIVIMPDSEKQYLESKQERAQIQSTQVNG